MRIHIKYRDLITIENVFQAWFEFRTGKRNKKDVQIFERNSEDNIFSLFQTLQDKSYRHGGYQAFYVNDPKRRHIHKASVIDRVVHHLLYNYLYSLYDKTFIHDSYSCRVGKGTHKGVARLAYFARKVSKNYTKDCFALKCDIKKFFASVDQETLEVLLAKKIDDPDIRWLLHEVIASFKIEELGNGKGIPLGNLTSQVFANIYMNELDQYVKHTLKVKYYLRYADDFIVLSENNAYLEQLLPKIQDFVESELKLTLHPDKIIYRKLKWGIDFLGYIILPHGVILPRTKTKRRLIKKLGEKLTEFNNGTISGESLNQTVQSYLGYLSHAKAYKLTEEIKNNIWFETPNPNFL